MPLPQSDPPLLCVPDSLPTTVARALEAAAAGPLRVQRCAEARDALERAQEGDVAAWLFDARAAQGEADALAEVVPDIAEDAAVLVVVDEVAPPAYAQWMSRGVQELLHGAELADADALAQRVHAAIERKRYEREARKAYATDLETGLPHRQQLIEHMSQLIALRERQPSPMALLVLRIEGLAGTRARRGDAAAQVLRRKIAVRLRAGVRASDVVASLGDDTFAVLLGAMLAAADGARVGGKLQAALLDPFSVAGEDVAVASALGVAQYPEDGAHAEALLRRAVGLAASAEVRGRAGFANFAEGQGAGAANDE